MTDNTMIEIRKKERKIKELGEIKKPSSSSKANFVGIEIEFFSNKLSNFRDLLVEHNLEKNCHPQRDSSIEPNDPDQQPCELTVLCKEKSVEDVLRRVCNVLAIVDANVNKSCGLHVHIDVRNRNAGRIFKNLVTAQQLFFDLCPKSRKRNGYCKKQAESDLYQAIEGCDRYYGINAHAVSKYKTVECRIHSGTVEFKKIFNWVTLLLSVAKIPSESPINFSESNLNKLKGLLNLSDDLHNYIKERITKFTPQSKFLVGIDGATGVTGNPVCHIPLEPIANEINR